MPRDNAGRHTPDEISVRRVLIQNHLKHSAVLITRVTVTELISTDPQPILSWQVERNLVTAY